MREVSTMDDCKEGGGVGWGGDERRESLVAVSLYIGVVEEATGSGPDRRKWLSSLEWKDLVVSGERRPHNG